MDVSYCQHIYRPTPGGIFDIVIDNGKVRLGIKKLPAYTIIACAGSEDLTDWEEDFEAIPYTHYQLGVIHLGMWQGVQDAFKQALPYLQGQQLVFMGHSKGCATAGLLAGLCGYNGIPVKKLILFAPPKFAYKQLMTFLKSWVSGIEAYRNSIDPVPEVPLTLPLEDWQQIVPAYIKLDEKPGGLDDIDPIAYHNLALYIKGYNKLQVA